MNTTIPTTLLYLCAITIVLSGPVPSWAQRQRHWLPNEQGTIQFRQSQDFAAAALPSGDTPPTVTSDDGLPVWELTLDEAISVALANTDVVRVLSGAGAASSGQTIYSPGIANTGIDQARAAFDPTLSVRNSFSRNEQPGPVARPGNRAAIVGSRSNDYALSVDVNKRFLSGANAALGVRSNRTQVPGPALLNPSDRSNVEFSLTQPLLRGRGANVNSVPIVLAFLDTEASYFRLKGSLQNMIAGVIQGYWDLVQARLEVWVTQQQIEQAEFAVDLDRFRVEAEIVGSPQLALSSASLANFRANLVAAEANVLNRVASLRAIMGLPPGSNFTIVPTTPPNAERLDFNWDALVELAASRRPDLVELKIILEADRQRIMQAKNFAQPNLDAVGLYRWNGLEGTMPVGETLRADPGQHTDWALSVNFSVPFTLRADRANLRRNELLLASDQANFRQGLLRASHSLASVVRSLEQLYVQHDAFKQARVAAEVSLDAQFENYRAERIGFNDVLLAINTWAGSVTSEARAVTQLNATLAQLETETGTILETHGVRLFEERYCSLGPLGNYGKGREYPSALRPSQNDARYPASGRASEQEFNLKPPVESPETARVPAPLPRY